MSTKKDTTKRDRRSKQEIALDKLRGARSRLKIKLDRLAKIEAEESELRTEVEEIQREVDYLKQNPYLPADLNALEQHDLDLTEKDTKDRKAPQVGPSA